MTDLEVDGSLWRTLEPSLPPRERSPKGGHPFADDRACFRGILFAMRTGRPWREVPRDMVVSGVICWRRLRGWQAAGVWTRLHETALVKLGRSGGLDRSRSSLDSSSVRAKKGGGRRGRPLPHGPGARGTKFYLIVDRRGTPLALLLSGANRNDSKLLAPLLDAVHPVQGARGRPRRRPAKLHADKGYDHASCREACRARGVADRIARRGQDPSKRLGCHRWVVERAFAHLRDLRRLATRWERKAAHCRALALLGCALLCLRGLARHLGLRNDL